MGFSTLLVSTLTFLHDPAGAQTSPAGIGSQDQNSTANPESGGSTTDPGRSAAPRTTPFTFRSGIGLDEVYTSNAGGVAGSSASSADFYTRGTATANVRYASRSLLFTADYALTGDYYAKFHELNEYSNYLNLGTYAALIPDRLVLNATAFANPVQLSRVGALSPNGELGGSSNNTNSYGYSVQPEFLMRFDNIAQSTTSASQAGLYFVSPYGGPTAAFPTASAVQNTNYVDVNERIQSGQYFGRVQWTITGDYNRLQQAGLLEISESGNASLHYALDHSFALVGTVGYDFYDINLPLGVNLTGPSYMGGFTFTPNESSLVSFQAGVRRNFPVYIGNVNWNISPKVSLNGLLTDSITTPQGSILQGLNGYGSGLLGSSFPNTGGLTTGVPTGISSGLPNLGTSFPAFGQGLALTNGVYHERIGTLGLAYSAIRTTYSLNATYDQRDEVDLSAIDPRTSLWGINATISRQMRTDLTGHISGGYSHADEFGGNDGYVTAEAGLNYQVSEVLTTYAVGRYVGRVIRGVAGVNNAPLDVEEVQVGVRRTF